jgi:prepilin-type N-terminal cleavage/methylation domain-containing protein
MRIDGRRAMHRRASGFSLLEVMLVMLLIAAMSVLAAAAVTGGFAGMRMRAEAKEIAAQLRYTRAQAISTGQSQKFLIDPAAHTWLGAEQPQGRCRQGLRREFLRCARSAADARRGRDPVLPRRRIHRRPRATHRQGRGVEYRHRLAHGRGEAHARRGASMTRARASAVTR